MDGARGAHLILDNLLAQGKIKPMIVVMPDGHAASFSRTGEGDRDGSADAAPVQPAGAATDRQAEASARMLRNVKAFRT